MKRLCVLTLFVALAPLGPALAEPQYRPRSLLHGGYRDRQIESGLWRVTVGLGRDGALDSAARMALYRAAELANAQGYSFVQIVWHRGGMRYRQQGRRMDVLGHSAELKAQGLHDSSRPGRCEMPTAKACPIHSVSQVLSQLRPVVLGQR